MEVKPAGSLISFKEIHFIKNTAAAFGITYGVLEGVEAAHGMNVRHPRVSADAEQR